MGQLELPGPLRRWRQQVSSAHGAGCGPGVGEDGRQCGLASGGSAMIAWYCTPLIPVAGLVSSTWPCTIILLLVDCSSQGRGVRVLLGQPAAAAAPRRPQPVCHPEPHPPSRRCACMQCTAVLPIIACAVALPGLPHPCSAVAACTKCVSVLPTTARLSNTDVQRTRRSAACRWPTQCSALHPMLRSVLCRRHRCGGWAVSGMAACLQRLAARMVARAHACTPNGATWHWGLERQ